MILTAGPINDLNQNAFEAGPRNGVLCDETARALPCMNADQIPSGLQAVALNERHRLIRFLVARGAGEDAEDLFQELWQRVARIATEPVADPVSYLFRCAENLMRDVRRSVVSRERRQFEWHEAGDNDAEHPLGERVLIAREQLQQVDAALEALGPRAAQVFRAYRIEGRSQAVIAREQGVSLSSIEKDLQKAYRALAQLKAKFLAE